MKRDEEVIQSLRRARAKDLLHHAYCFCGPVGVGKKETVERFGGEVFGSADRIRRGMHPDFVRVTPKEGAIKVDEVRDVIKGVAYAPLEAPLRIVLIESADSLNPQAANALLKTLEEPPVHTVFFLTAPDPELLLPTIRSRCQVVRFFPLGETELKEKLSEFPQDAVENTLQFAEGSVERARTLLVSSDLLELRREATEVMLEMWEACPRIPFSMLSFLDRLKEAENVELTLAVWLSLLRDFSLALSGGGNFYNPEYRARLEGLAGKVRGWIQGEITVSELSAELAEKCSAIDRFRVQREFHLNLRLGLDALIADLQIFSVGKARQKQ